ncbi:MULTISPECIES: urea ABC transporter permease subunit UrtC [Rhodopseudomonas]|uniref:Amino acid ABC transporter permease n=1 Tax=Rhodopseudomonas palustris TaxID=1076 RepID=A0A0D7F815_RHOPL|nr:MULTISPECIES: urea ABC transporter permease subunit UrtC [Rhodopseudomonas]KIZ47857.1 amino acid ABC transporter permease [Rhodopseudomonas palustris]MDF3813775.1 urea ABC transporter permease subunit UrtC [Rhodopseudomonas sp. BAL398]WOK17660.1 urea ABC transporter permease subunit UrtC [Rhodopseudomonas sp. BAL398]
MKALTSDRPFLALLAVVLAVAVLLGISMVSPFGISAYLANAIGQFAAFAVLALALDLVWGYLGILSLGHGLFFGIGGYVVAMHLLKHSSEVTGKVPDFMQFMGWSTYPFYWAGLGFFPYALLFAAAVTLLISGVFGYVSFRSRVGGVYFAIITQALVYVAMLLMFRNDTGFGGNNGMTGFSVLFGWSIGSSGVVIAMAAGSVLVLAVTLLGCRMLLGSRFGMLMIATRDDEVRLRTLGYETLRLKLAVWCLSALIAALAGMLYVPQVGIVNPRLLAPELSLEIAVWVAIGGRGHLIGAVIGAVLVNALKFWLSAAAPDLWPFILSGLIVLVVLVFPNGLVDLAKWKLAWPMGAKRLASETPELR